MCEIPVVLDFHPLHMRAQGLFDRPRQHGHAIVRPFPIPHRDLLVFTVEILDPQAQALQVAQPRAVHQHGDDPCGPGKAD